MMHCFTSSPWGKESCESTTVPGLSQVRSSNGCCRMPGIRFENGITAAVSEVPSIGTMATCHRPGRPFRELSVAAVTFKKEKDLRGSPKLSLKFQCFGGRDDCLIHEVVSLQIFQFGYLKLAKISQFFGSRSLRFLTRLDRWQHGCGSKWSLCSSDGLCCHHSGKSLLLLWPWNDLLLEKHVFRKVWCRIYRKQIRCTFGRSAVAVAHQSTCLRCEIHAARDGNQSFCFANAFIAKTVLLGFIAKCYCHQCLDFASYSRLRVFANEQEEVANAEFLFSHHCHAFFVHSAGRVRRWNCHKQPGECHSFLHGSHVCRYSNHPPWAINDEFGEDMERMATWSRQGDFVLG